MLCAGEGGTQLRGYTSKKRLRTIDVHHIENTVLGSVRVRLQSLGVYNKGKLDLVVQYRTCFDAVTHNTAR